MSTLVKLDIYVLFRMALEFFRYDHGKGVKYQLTLLEKWIISKQGCYAEKTIHFFVDLNEMHLLTKFHANQRSLGGLKVTKIFLFCHFEFIDFGEKFEKHHFS